MLSDQIREQFRSSNPIQSVSFKCSKWLSQDLLIFYLSTVPVSPLSGDFHSPKHAISNRLCRSRPCYQTSTDSYLVRSCASFWFWKPLKASQVMQGMYLPRKTSSKDAYAKAYAPSRIKFLHQTSTSASNRSKNEPLINFSPSCEI
jgi:hypothetical protein